MACGGLLNLPEMMLRNIDEIMLYNIDAAMQPDDATLLFYYNIS
jgi:hypothetical protein